MNSRERILELLKQHPEGLDIRQIEENLDDYEIQITLDRMFYKDLIRRVEESGKVKWLAN